MEDVIVNSTEQYDFRCICQQPHTAQSSSNRKRKMVDFDRERASKCVRSDWFCLLPRFDDRQFERTFHLKRSMVEKMVSSLTDFDPFWLSSVDCCGRMSIDLLVKFLAAQKMICYGISDSAFKDYFQMGERTARLFLGQLT